MWTLEQSVHPCPFCGSTAIRALEVGGTRGLLQCQTCQAQGPLGQTQALAVQGWHTRGRPVPQPCLHCGTVFQPRVPSQQYCRPVCKAASLRLVRREERATQRLVQQQRVREAQRELHRAQRQQAREAQRQQAREAQRLAEAYALVQQHQRAASS